MLDKVNGFWGKLFSALPHPVRWFLSVIIGFIVVIVGIIMMPLPGPGTLIVLVGLTLLSLEFEWARQLVKEGEQWMERIVSFFKSKWGKNKGSMSEEKLM